MRSTKALQHKEPEATIKELVDVVATAKGAQQEKEKRAQAFQNKVLEARMATVQELVE